ncbi:MAG: imelysin family protein, partial [Pseudomonadota bacterium]
MKKQVCAVVLAAGLAACGEAKVTEADVLETYADIAEAMYSDALATAEDLDKAVDRLLKKPSKKRLEAAREAWLAARVPYQHTEVYRFGNAYVDEWEGRVNAWPLDEGLIDYVDASYGTESDENVLYTANIIANPVLTLGGKDIDATKITADLLQNELHEADGVEANVATGYHAIEFLLWGQDLNGDGPGAGDRPWTDYAKRSKCTGGNCDRRGRYLRVSTDLLIADLEEIVEAWSDRGAARKALMDAGPQGGIQMMLTGMGSLSYGELAGERMKLGLLLNDPEEEHDCFADNTHNSHYYNIVGIRNVYFGTYKRVNGKTVTGPSLHDLLEDAAPKVAEDMVAALNVTLDKASAMKARAESVEAYDQMLGAGNAEGNAVLQAVIDALVGQTRVIER